MKRLIKTIGLLICLNFLLAGCQTEKELHNQVLLPTVTENVEEEKKDEITFPLRKDGIITLSLGFSTNSQDPRGVASRQFKEEVETNTMGTVKIDIYSDAELGSDADLIAGVIDGTVDMTVSSAGNFTGYAKNVGVSALPFLFDSFEDAWKFMDSEIVQEINTELLKYNIRVLSHFDNGFRCVTTSSVPVNVPDDMKGLIIRTPSNTVVQETMSVLGAEPIALDFSELKEALKNNEFDAQENPIPVVYNNKLYEVQSYLSITNHSYDAMPFVISDAAWQMLTREEQKIIKEAANHAQQLNRSLVQSQTEEYVTKLQTECGMTVIYPQIEGFKDKTKNVRNFFSYDEQLMSQIDSFINRNRLK